MSIYARNFVVARYWISTLRCKYFPSIHHFGKWLRLSLMIDTNLILPRPIHHVWRFW